MPDMTIMSDLQTNKVSVSYSGGMFDMLINWLEVRSKLTHFGALFLAWFWSQYTFDNSFRDGVDKWIHGLHPYLRVFLGASMSFYFWYRNPNRKEK